MREAGVRDQLAIFQEFHGLDGGEREWDDLVVFSVEDEDGYIDAFQVFGEICFGEGFDTVGVRLDGAHHSLTPPVVADALGDLCSGAVIAVEGDGEVLEILGAVEGRALADLVEYGQGDAVGVCAGLNHQRRDCADEDGFGYAAFSVFGDIADHFAAACGVTDVDGVFQVECLCEFGDVSGVGIHFVAFVSLG